MSNGRAMRRKIKGVKGTSKRKLKPVAGGMMTRQQLTEMMKPVREAFRDAEQEAGVEADGDDAGDDADGD